MLEHLPSMYIPLATVSSSGMGEGRRMEHNVMNCNCLLLKSANHSHRVLVPVSLDLEGAGHTRENSFPHYLIYATHITDMSPFGGEWGKGIAVLPRLALDTWALMTSSSAPRVAGTTGVCSPLCLVLLILWVFLF